jgi:CRISPR/Cas system-associated exonuclease Cas4 (RecB family)
VRISNSKANTYRRCPKRFYYKYVLGLRPIRKVIQLERGSWMHSLLEAHYLGEDWKRIHKELTKQFNTLFEEERENLGDLPGECLRIMRGYLRKYKKEDRRWKVIDAEVDEIVTMKNGLEFHFIIDLVVEDRELGGLWLWDHKFVKNFMDADYMLLDAQLARYFWSAEKLGYKPLKGVMFNEVRTKPPTIPHTLKAGGVSQAKSIDTDYLTYLRAIEECGDSPGNYTEILHRLKTQPERFFRRTTMPKDRALTKRTMRDLLQTAAEIEEAEANNRYPRAVNKTCTWDCDFKDVCITEYFGADPSSLIEANFTRKDEYAANGDS